MILVAFLDHLLHDCLHSPFRMSKNLPPMLRKWNPETQPLHGCVDCLKFHLVSLQIDFCSNNNFSAADRASRTPTQHTFNREKGIHLFAAFISLHHFQRAWSLYRHPLTALAFLLMHSSGNITSMKLVHGIRRTSPTGIRQWTYFLCLYAVAFLQTSPTNV